MSEKKIGSRNEVVIALTALCIISLVGFSASVIVYTQQNSSLQAKDSQIISLQTKLDTPKLVSVGLAVHRQQV